jgi:flagellar L-ring protein precursor FlgH
MKHKFITTVISMILITGSTVRSGADQINSLYSKKNQRQAPQDSVSPSGSPSTMNPSGHLAGSKPSADYTQQKKKSAMQSSWITVAEPQPKEFRVHDLITIVVHEVSKHTTKADTKADRALEVQAKIADWIRLTDGNIRPDKQTRGDPTVGLSFDREFEGKSDIKREDTLSTRIQAEIIDIYPNGNLLLEATHNITTDEETTTITLTGICRSQDIGIDNTIFSNKLANLNVAKHHTGIAHDTNKRGWLVRILEAVSPF